MVTIDAAGCQKAVVEQIRRRGGEYVVCAKGNHGSLRDAVAAVFDRAADAAFAGCAMFGAEGAGHGREEGRYVTVVANPDGLPAGWSDVGSAALVCRERQLKGASNESSTRYYITSLRCGAEELAGYIRNHWGVENGLHWVLDVAFREDESRTRAGHTAANLAMVRRVALSLLARAGNKGSIKARRMRAGWDDQYLLQVLQGIPAN